MCANTYTFQAKVLSAEQGLPLFFVESASFGARTLITFLKYPGLGPQMTPSV